MALPGTIRSYDAADCLGTIVLDDGREVRFGLSACKFVAPHAGARVRVAEVIPGFGGRLRATRIDPETAPRAPAVEERWVWPARSEELEESPVAGRWYRNRAFDLEQFAQEHPRWAAASQARDAALRPLRANDWPAPAPLPAHPFFDPWRDQVPGVALPALAMQFEHGAGESFVDGGVSDRRCGRCGEPLSLLAVFGPGAFAAFVERPEPLTILHCDACLEVLLIAGRPTSPPRASSRSVRLVPFHSLPAGQADCRLTLPGGDALFGVLVASGGDCSSAWFAYDRWTGALDHPSRIGGFAPWIQGDDTPRCDVCGGSMRLLFCLAEDAGLDLADCGSLFAFLCGRRQDCPGFARPRFVLQSH
jgi:hypothetical protein